MVVEFKLLLSSRSVSGAGVRAYSFVLLLRGSILTSSTLVVLDNLSNLIMRDKTSEFAPSIMSLNRSSGLCPTTTGDASTGILGRAGEPLAGLDTKGFIFGCGLRDPERLCIMSGLIGLLPRGDPATLDGLSFLEKRRDANSVE